MKAENESYLGLPPLAGVCEMGEAMRDGLSVDDCVRRLKRYHYALRRQHHLLLARLASEPIYELKMAFSLHAHLCAEHVSALRRRVGEMREPPLGLEAVPDDALRFFYDELLSAPRVEFLLLGLYERAVPALMEGMRRHQAETNPLVDHPSLRVLKFALIELEEMARYGGAAIDRLVSAELREEAAEWLDLLDVALAVAGGLDGTQPRSSEALRPRFSGTPYVYDGVPQRDSRFPDPYNMGVNAEVFLYDKSYPAATKTLMMYYKRLREIDVPEMMSSIITETPGKPWDYYRDMTRQLWDEARHAMMGEVGFVSEGIPWPRQVMVNFTWSLALNTQLQPLERHAVLYFIEQGLMPKSGKRFEWETAIASGNRLCTLFQDYDWADEVLHARIGRDWYLREFKDAREAVDYGDACWSRVLMNWNSWREEGKTEHRNWWPEVYRTACANRGVDPDPAVLSYSVTYESVRADLKDISASA